MLTRGHRTGQIIDDLAGIAAQARQRGRLHLFDIHTHVMASTSRCWSLCRYPPP